MPNLEATLNHNGEERRKGGHHKFKHQLGGFVTIKGSEKTGQVIGRAEYANTPTPSYLVRYINGRGDQCEEWFTGDRVYDEPFIHPF